MQPGPDDATIDALLVEFQGLQDYIADFLRDAGDQMYATAC